MLSYGKIRQDMGITCVEDIECLVGPRLRRESTREHSRDLTGDESKMIFWAICLLEQAAADGSSAGSAMLGHTLYKERRISLDGGISVVYRLWGRGSKFGQRNTLRNILNHKKYNLRIFTGAFALCFIWASALDYGAGQPLFWKSSCRPVGFAGLAGIVYCVGVRRFWKYPYDFELADSSYGWIVVRYLIIWS